MKRFVHWPTFFLSLLVCAVIAFAAHWIFGVSVWLALPIVVVAVVVNGALALWEDEQPGGFNNPEGKE